MSWNEYHPKWTINVEIIKDGNYHAQNFMCSSKKIWPSSRTAVKNFNKNPSSNMKLRVEKFYTLNKTRISLSVLDVLSFATKFCDEVLHRMSCKVLHRMSCKVLHRMSCKVLHRTSCKVLHRMSCKVLYRMACKSHQKFSRLYYVTGRRRLSPIRVVHLFRKLRLWSNKNMTS